MTMHGECRWCGLTHGPTCSMVKAIEFHEDGETVKRVEFKGAAEYGVVSLSGQWTPITRGLPAKPIQTSIPPAPFQSGWPTHVISYGDGTCSACQTTGVCNCVRGSPYTSSTGAIQS